MKIKKLLPEQISDKTLGFKDYRKIIRPALKLMVGLHNSPETATEFLAKTNFEFADMKGKKMGFLLPGDFTAQWKKMAKEEIQKEKKLSVIGSCYIKKGTDGSLTLVLIPIKGAAKKNLLIKQLEKFVLKGTPLSVEIAKGGEMEEDNAADVVVEDVEFTDEPDSSSDSEEQEDDEKEISAEHTQYKLKMNEKLDKMKAQIEKIKQQLKM